MSKILCSCGKAVETQPEWAGQWITCPGCSGALYAPFPGPKPAPDIELTAATRLCAWCAETISMEDRRCTYCGGDPHGAVEPRPAGPQPQASGPRVDTGGTGILAMGLIGFMFCQLLSPIAWSMGASYEADCRRRGVEPSGTGTAGKILGIIGSALLALALVIMALTLSLPCR